MDPPMPWEERTDYRSVSGVAQFLSGDRLDIKFAVKEVLRESAHLRRSTWTRLKRLGRYLKRVPRYVTMFRWQTKGTRVMKIGVDASHAGCQRTRKSTSGVLITNGHHMLCDQSATQGRVRLSSGEAEYAAMVKGVAEGLFVKNILKFLGENVELELETDSTAAIGTARRLGAGKKMRHMETEAFFLQGLIRQKEISIKKKLGTEHPPDIATKHLPWSQMVKLLGMLDVKLLTLAGLAVLPGAEAQVVQRHYQRAATAVAEMRKKGSGASFVDWVQFTLACYGACVLCATLLRQLAVLGQALGGCGAPRALVQRSGDADAELVMLTSPSGEKAHLYESCKALAHLKPQKVKRWPVCVKCLEEKERQIDSKKQKDG
jgi:hypothetical protein